MPEKVVTPTLFLNKPTGIGHGVHNSIQDRKVGLPSLISVPVHTCTSPSPPLLLEEYASPDMVADDGSYTHFWSRERNMISSEC